VGAEVLDVGHRGPDRAHHGRVERPASGGEEREAGEPAERLEAPRGHVLVRDGVPGGVRGEPEGEGALARAREGADEPAGGDVEGDDHPLKDCSRALV
jgi:hypothetical protein